MVRVMILQRTYQNPLSELIIFLFIYIITPLALDI